MKPDQVASGRFLLSSKNFVLYLEDKASAMEAAGCFAQAIFGPVSVWCIGHEYTVQPAYEKPVIAIAELVQTIEPDE